MYDTCFTNGKLIISFIKSSFLLSYHHKQFFIMCFIQASLLGKKNG